MHTREHNPGSEKERSLMLGMFLISSALKFPALLIWNRRRNDKSGWNAERGNRPALSYHRCLSVSANVIILKSVTRNVLFIDSHLMRPCFPGVCVKCRIV